MTIVSSKGESPKKGKRKPGEEVFRNRLHPIQVEYTYPIGVRIDMDRALPLDLEEDDPDAVLDNLAGPPVWEDRISPLSATLNNETLHALNPTDLEIKFLRRFVTQLARVAGEVEIASRVRFGEKGPVSFMGLCLHPETINRLIDSDYDTADNIYSHFVELMDKGFITPVATTPFHTLLPLYQHDFEIRLLIRTGLEFYWPMLKKYNRAVARYHGERYYVVPFMLPEGAINAKVLQILHQEFTRRCEAEEITPAHLIILLDTEQSKEREQDVLMKRWNTMRPSPTTRDIVSIIYRERSFSDWVMTGHPSTKKQLDRTIAKVDAALRDQGIDHLWSHFEPLMTLLGTFKSCANFEQKIIKLTELKYQPCGPDVFVRRKLLKLHGTDETEPRRTGIRDNTTWNGWPETEASLSRFTGFTDIGGFTPKRVLAEPRSYQRPDPKGGETPITVEVSPIWKVALMGGLQRMHRAILGEPKTFMGGMLGLIRETIPVRRVPVAMRNIEDFLVAFSRISWKEHFIHHNVCSEADIQLLEMCETILLRDAPEEEDPSLEPEQCAAIGAAAHAIFLAFQALNSTGFAFENIDTRATYENVALMTLATAHAISALTWLDEKEKAAELFATFKTELLEFGQAFERQNFAREFGIDRAVWEAAIASEVPAESDLNVVERAARRLGAKHLRLLGFRKDFDRKDEFISTATGHIWSQEIGHGNIRWENEAFCGIREE